MGKQVKKAELAEIIGVSERTLTTWQKNGMPISYDGRRGEANLYDTENVIAWRIKNRIQEITGEGDKSGLNLEQERAQLAQEQHRKIKRENDIEDNLVAPLGILTDALASITTQMASIFEALPLTLKKRCPSLTAKEVEVIKKEIAKTRNTAARVKLHAN